MKNEERYFKGNVIINNFIISVFVQGVSLLITLISGFCLPRFMDEYQYAYREMFCLYISYAGLMHLGLLDGLILKYSKFDYDVLDKPRILSQLKVMLGIIGSISTLIILISVWRLDDVYRNIACLVAVGILTRNFVTYVSYLFQMTNQIGKYAKVIFGQRVVYGISIVLLLFFNVYGFEWYCLAEIVGDLVTIVVSIILNKDFFQAKGIPFKLAIIEWGSNVKAGIVLLVANLTSSLVLGCAKMIIQWNWDALVFGKLAFSFSLSSVFISFVNAISVVLFPTLKRMEEEKLAEYYLKLRQGLSIVLYVILLGYFPLCQILEIFIPAYIDSLKYLGVFLPIITYTARVNVLTNNYLKAYRKEKSMLMINLLSIAIGIVLYAISALVLNDVFAILIAMVIVVVVNSILSENIISKILDKNLLKFYIQEIVLTVLFIVFVNVFSRWEAFGYYLIFYLIYLLINRREINPIITRLKQMITR